LLTGFDDGVVRALLRCSDGLRLLKAIKPHNSRVTCIAVCAQERIVATGSQDGTIFFLDLDDDYDPIGFVNFGSAVKSLSWLPKGSQLLVCGESGRVARFESPRGFSANTSTTFLLQMPATEYVLSPEV